MGGKGGSSPSAAAQSNPYSEAQAAIAKDFYGDTDPMRQELFNQSMGFLNGTMPVDKMPQFAPLYSMGKQGLEDQFAASKESIMGSTPVGGALTGALTNLETGKAAQLGSLPAQISSQLTQDVYNKTYGTAMGAPSQSMSGLGTAGGTYANTYNSQLAANTQQSLASQNMMLQLGTGAGMMAAMGGCCFIFVEAHGGMLHPVVRQYRDDHMTERNRRGYYWLAERLVPAMRKHEIVFRAVKYIMVDPMVKYGKWFYGLDRKGWIFAPVKSFWLGVFNILGKRPPYRRHSGEVV
jgi:hypothetical protein